MSAYEGKLQRTLVLLRYPNALTNCFHHDLSELQCSSISCEVNQMHNVFISLVAAVAGVELLMLIAAALRLAISPLQRSRLGPGSGGQRDGAAICRRRAGHRGRHQRHQNQLHLKPAPGQRKG